MDRYRRILYGDDDDGDDDDDNDDDNDDVHYDMIFIMMTMMMEMMLVMMARQAKLVSGRRSTSTYTTYTTLGIDCNEPYHHHHQCHPHQSP